jgi:hypothetical protein
VRAAGVKPTPVGHANAIAFDLNAAKPHLTNCTRCVLTIRLYADH